MDQFILFGDSLTQQSADDRGFIFLAALSNAYVRRLDIINRGFSGYETNKAVRVLQRVLPSPEQAKIRFLTVFFGANDTCRPDVPGKTVVQHVPLETYTENLRRIVNHPHIRAHKDIRIILITPPPVDERKLYETDSVSYPDLGNETQRSAQTVAKYAQAVRNVGREEGIAVLDLWTSMMKIAGYSEGQHGPLPGQRSAPENAQLRDMLHDGLHFTGKGYEVLYSALLALIEHTWPDQTPQNLDMVMPKWDDTDAW